MEPLNEYSTHELEALLQVIEKACIEDPDTALRMERWYERVKEALNQAYNDTFEAEYNDYDEIKNDFDLRNEN